MKKVIFQGVSIVILFFATLFVLRQINWIKIFRVQQATEKTEEKLGELFWDFFSKTEKENKNHFVSQAVDSIVDRVCTANDIERSHIKLHILNKDEVNAFALPDGHLVVYSGLILAAEDQEELTGVICHEMAHIELNHVMKKLVKELGLSVLVSMTGGSGGELARETAKMLSSSAFDRKLEKVADLRAVDYMVKAEIDPEGLANFLYTLSDRDQEAMKYFSWISTHPDSRERATYIVAYCKKKKEVRNRPVLSEAGWAKLKERLRE
jgi:predicted Zn-dependent protease